MVWKTIDNIRGPQGPKGDPGTIASASAESIPPDQSASVTMTGSETVKHAHFKLPRGEKGDQGVPGTLSSASAESVPADQQAEVIMSGTTEVKHAHFKLPRGLPGVNGVENDEAIATYIEANDSQTKTALNGQYPVKRVWDGTAYPPRISGAVNLFIGPVDPGLLMESEDVWADPNLVTLDDVTAAMSTEGTALRTVTQSFVTPDRLYIPATGFAPIDTRAAAAFKPVSNANESASLSGWVFPKAEKPYISAVVRIPDGWNTANLYLHVVSMATPDGVTRIRTRVQAFVEGSDVRSVTTGRTYVRNYTPTTIGVLSVSGPYITKISAADMPESRLYMVVINRQISDDADTTTHSVIVVGAEFRRLT